MKFVFSNHKYFYILLLLFAVCEWIVSPYGEFPLNDDWSYSKSVLNWASEGNYNIGNWPSMTLFTHLLWGLLFTKVFGFSFVVLRVSTIISSLIGLWVLHNLVLKLSGSKIVSFVACLVLLFNPMYFNLTNTYMTDVNFNTLALICCSLACRFFERRSMSSLILFFITSLFLVLLRQFGVIFPLVFTIICLLLKERKIFFFSLSLVLSIAVMFVFKQYENYLKGILPPHSAYQFSEIFRNNFLVNLESRYKTISLHILLYTTPFSIMYLLSVSKRTSRIWLVVFAIVAGVGSYFIFKHESFPIGNIFSSYMSVGAETFYETLRGDLKSPHEHTYSETYEQVLLWVKYCFIAVNLFVICCMVLNRTKKRLEIPPAIIFICCLFTSYVFTLLIPQSFFDRYHLLPISLTLILLAVLAKDMTHHWLISLVLILPMIYVSVFGTKDYFTLNKTRWEAYAFAKTIAEKHPGRINGGFEVCCWNEGEFAVWYEFLSLRYWRYLIQYRKEENFTVLRTYEFQRFFPYKKDTLYLFERNYKSQ